jgi:hypothetical protein
MFPANTNSVKLKKSSFLWKVQTQGEDFCVDLPHRGKNVGFATGARSLFISPAKSIIYRKYDRENGTGIRDYRILRINNLRPGIDVDGNSLFRRE